MNSSKTKIITACFMLFFFLSCQRRDLGQLTLVNSNTDAIKISVDGRSFGIQPSNHITKEFPQGKHEIRINDGAPFAIEMQKDKTTAVDSSGLSCFAVLDFAQRYRGGNPQVVETFYHQQVFMTKVKMSTVLGSFLPKKISNDQPAMRLHQIDCEIIDDKIALITELAMIP
ncbi:MAG: hypothetical protein HYY43_06225 [Deltaproteobacteria bacterium]|nr:hypothetical protein [Deltaproteobacteria bacterium]MBI2341797.1 hypothetical protein [Deltaproteobacteria bacterium]MBI2975166.1 hypothetical protein [Deltaproteobacteria bacterium]